MAGEAYAKRYASGFHDTPATDTPEDSQFLNGVEAALLRLLGADPTDTFVQVWDAALARFKTVQISNAQIAAAAAIDKTKLAALNIVNADIAAGAAIDGSKIAGNFPISKLNNYPADSSKFLRGDGAWDKAPGTIMGFGLGQAVSTASTNFAGGQNLLAANISFTADGVSRYALVVLGAGWSNSFAGTTTMIASAVLDGAQGGLFNAMADNTGVLAPLSGAIDLLVPSAAVHTVNVRIYAGTGTTTIPANAIVTVVKVT
jgi:hypothetical protein